MKKRMVCALLVLCMALGAVVAAQAENLNLRNYAKARFGHGYPVYSGPGWDYYRANEGKATYGGGGVARVYGVTGKWVLIGYQTGTGIYRLGYIEKKALDDMTVIEGAYDEKLTFSNYTRYIQRDVDLTDDPVIRETPVCTLAQGTKVQVLGQAGHLSYVQVNTEEGLMRGFVPANALGKYQILPTPAPAQTAAPAEDSFVVVENEG